MKAHTSLSSAKCTFRSDARYVLSDFYIEISIVFHKYIPVFISFCDIQLMIFQGCSLCRKGEGGGGRFLNQTRRPNSFSLKHQGYCFLREFRNSTMFTVYATIFEKFTAASHCLTTQGNQITLRWNFSKGPILSVELYEKFHIVYDLKKDHNDQGLNIILQVESWTY